jgi:transcriptional regulator GlxA family with amidase domain
MAAMTYRDRSPRLPRIESNSASGQALVPDELAPILAAKAEIERNVAAQLYVADFANVAGLRAFTFTRRFARQFGVTPIRYRLQLRVERARQLLLEHPGAKISAIAREVGFLDVRFFHRAFRSAEGVSPRAYQRLHRERIEAPPSSGTELTGVIASEHDRRAV